MATYSEMVAQLTTSRDKIQEARDVRDAKEMAESVLPMMLEHEDYDYCRLKKSDPSLVGHVVLRPPNAPELARVRHVMWRDAKDAGVIEAKAKAGLELAAACVMWPPREQYEALIAKHPAAQDKIAKLAWTMAEAGAEAEVKE